MEIKKPITNAKLVFHFIPATVLQEAVKTTINRFPFQTTLR